MHSTIQTTFIGTQESVYRDSPAGKLEEAILLRDMLVPLQQGFDSDSQACLSVSIDALSAFAFEQGIIGAMPLPDSTAVGTPFARMPAIHDVQMNIIVETPLFENLLELEKGNLHGFPIEVPTFGFEPLEVFNGDVSVISLGNQDNLPDNLAEIGSNKVSFAAFDSLEFLPCLNGLKHSFSPHEYLSLGPDSLAEICLINNLAARSNNTNSEVLGVDINTENVLPMLNFRFFGQESYNLQVRGQTISLASPASIGKVFVPFPIPILLERNGNPVSGIEPESDKRISLGVEGLAVPWNIEFDSDRFGSFAFMLPCRPFNVAHNLGIEGGFLHAN